MFLNIMRKDSVLHTEDYLSSSFSMFIIVEKFEHLYDCSKFVEIKFWKSRKKKDVNYFTLFFFKNLEKLNTKTSI